MFFSVFLICMFSFDEEIKDTRWRPGNQTALHMDRYKSKTVYPV